MCDFLTLRSDALRERTAGRLLSAPLTGCVLALAAVGLITALLLATQDRLIATTGEYVRPYGIAYLLPIALITLGWGGGAGGFTLLLSLLSSAYFLMQPRYSLVLAHPRRDAIEFVALALAGSVVIVCLEAMRASRERTRTLLLQEQENEETLRQHAAALEDVSQRLWMATKLATMGELAASIAHELNNPLATVSLRVESLLARTPPGDPGRRALEIIEGEVDRMANLVRNLLQFSRRGPQISTLDIREQIEATLELLEHHLRSRHVTVLREFAPDVPMIAGDRQQLWQVFLNLFTNASDAMPEGGVLTLRVEPAGSGVAVEVRDTGQGIAPEDLPRLFESFFTTKPEGKGTGLGLPICRRIVEEHGGTIQLASEPGKGTTVRILLPGINAAEATGGGAGHDGA